MTFFSVKSKTYLKLLSALTLAFACHNMAQAQETSATEAPVYRVQDLMATTPTSFSHPDIPLGVHFLKPQAFAESVIASPTRLIISYLGLNNRVQLQVSLIAEPTLSAQTTTFEDFKHFVFARFHDKEQQLFGEYQISHEASSAEQFDLSFTAYLKKAADGILPEMYNFIAERDIKQGEVIAQGSCQILGSQAQQRESAALFKELSPLCTAFTQSLRLEPLEHDSK